MKKKIICLKIVFLCLCLVFAMKGKTHADVGSFDRFRETNGIEIIEDEEKEQYRIKIDIPNVEEQCLFTVRNIYNSMIYLQAYQQNKDICVCKVCGKDFIKTSNNQKTCGKSCSDVLQRLNVAKRNEKNRKTEVKEQKVI